MFTLNKIVGFLCDPVNVAALGALVAFVSCLVGRKRLAGGLLVGCIVWTWLWATPLMSRVMGASLERPYLVKGIVPQLDDYPPAEIIELHGGSMGIATNLCLRGEMSTSADRVWMTARLWKAGKAPKIIVTGGGVKESTMGLLMDFGIPTNAVIIAEEPRNTEEEAKWISSRFKSEFEKGRDNSTLELKTQTQRPKVLVVTSAWHMRRTMLLYAKYAPNVEAIPAPCDFENTLGTSGPWTPLELLPNPASLVWNAVCFHEWLGIVGYKWFR